MRIFVFSDTHGDTSGMELVLSKTKPDVLIHCGDGIEDAIAIQKKYPDIKVHAVPGNCDKESLADKEIYVEIMDHRIYITHGDQFNHGVSVTRSGAESEIVTHAKQQGVDIILHGHTHLATFFIKDDVYVLNPGSAAAKKPYDFKPSSRESNLHSGGELLNSPRGETNRYINEFARSDEGIGTRIMPRRVLV